MPIFDAKNEALSREILEQVQLERLQAVLNRVQRNVSWYRRQLQEARIGPGDIQSLADLSRLPMTPGKALAEGYPYSMFAVPLREVIRLHSVPGPDGRTLVVGHTRNDVRQWARLAARTLAAAGVSETDVVQICFGEGFFVEGMGFQYGAELLGASGHCLGPFSRRRHDQRRHGSATLLGAGFGDPVQYGLLRSDIR